MNEDHVSLADRHTLHTGVKLNGACTRIMKA